ELSYTARARAPGDGVTFVNTVTVTGSDQYDPNPNNDTATATVAPLVADLAITKTQIAAPPAPEPGVVLTVDDMVEITPSTITAGNQIHYLLTITNAGPDNAINATVTDALPAGLSNVEFSRNFGNSWNAWSGALSYASFTAGSTDFIVIRGTVAADQTQDVINTASVDSDTHDPVSTNNQDTLTTPVTQSADLALTKEELDAPIEAGGAIDYRITVENLGPSDASGVVITDALSNDVSDAEYSLNGTDWSDWLGSYTVGDLARGETFQLLIRGTVVAAPSGTAITNTASVSATTQDPNPDNDAETIETPLDEFVDLSIVKTGSPATVTAGEQILYTLTVTNHNAPGGFAARTVRISDVFDPAVFTGIEYSTTGVDGPWSPWVSPLALGELAAGEARTIVLRATVKSTVTAIAVTNTATVTTDTPDLDPTNNTSTEETPIERRADLKMEKRLLTAPENVVAGGQVQYELVYTNLGPSDASNVVVTDAVPAAIVNPEAAFCATTSYQPWTGSANVGTVVAGGECRIFIRGTLAADYKGSLTNTASVASDITDPISENNEDSREITVLNPSIALSKVGTLNDDDGTTGVSAGDTISYVFTVTNTGNATLTNITLVDAVAGVSISGGPIATLAPDAVDDTTFTGTYTLTQADIDAGSFTNTATVKGQYPGIPDVTDSDEDTQTLERTPALTLEKELTTAPEPIELGSELTYTVTATNTGNVTLTDVVVSDSLITPASETCASVAPTQTCVLSGTYTVTQADMDVGQVVNTATADSDQTDAVTDAVTTLIDTTPALTVEKVLTSADPNPIVLGSVLTYTVTATNDGDVTLTDVVVSDP
ncbi:MAG: DUF11 domain-containing protein, partial [Sphingobacteriia bacterium]|nr:DUF11 domain-containing protein [Sphingobacteriia bacterium]